MNQILNQPLEGITRQILDKLYGLRKSTILFGIDGGQGAGKSTFLRQFKRIVDEDKNYTSIALETDNFLLDRSRRENLPISYFNDPKNISNLWDFQRLSELLNRFMVSYDTSIPVKDLYDHNSGKRNKVEIFTFHKKNIIILGGPYILNSSFPNFDFKVFLKVSKDKRFDNNIAEGMARGKSFESRKNSFEKFENFFDPYFSTKLAMYNMIIDNNDFNNPFIAR